MISYLVVNWNGGEIFKKSLLSIQTMMEGSAHNYEIIIVDNASADFDEEWIRKNIAGVLIEKNEVNVMFARGTNQSIKLVSGELLCIINNDIIFHPGCIENLIKGLERNKCDLVVPKMLNPDGTVQKSIRNFPTLAGIMASAIGIDRLNRKFDTWLLHNFDYNKFSFVQQPMFSAILLPKDTWKTVGDMDENFPILFNDVDWFKRFINIGLKACFIPDAVVTHVHGMSVNKRRFKKVYNSTCGMYRYFIKHGDRNLIFKPSLFFVLGTTFAGRLFSEFFIKRWR